MFKFSFFYIVIDYNNDGEESINDDEDDINVLEEDQFDEEFEDSRESDY